MKFDDTQYTRALDRILEAIVKEKTADKVDHAQLSILRQAAAALLLASRLYHMPETEGEGSKSVTEAFGPWSALEGAVAILFYREYRPRVLSRARDYLFNVAAPSEYEFPPGEET